MLGYAIALILGAAVGSALKAYWFTFHRKTKVDLLLDQCETADVLKLDESNNGLMGSGRWTRIYFLGGMQISLATDKRTSISGIKINGMAIPISNRQRRRAESIAVQRISEHAMELTYQAVLAEANRLIEGHRAL